MTDATPKDGQERPRSSRQRYRIFVDDYKHKRLDDKTDALNNQHRLIAPESSGPGAVAEKGKGLLRGRRKEYLREYMKWLWPHRGAVIAFIFLALVRAGLEMIE